MTKEHLEIEINKVRCGACESSCVRLTEQDGYICTKCGELFNRPYKLKEPRPIKIIGSWEILNNKF